MKVSFFTGAEVNGHYELGLNLFRAVAVRSQEHGGRCPFNGRSSGILGAIASVHGRFILAIRSAINHLALFPPPGRLVAARAA